MANQISTPFYNEDHEAFRAAVRQFTEKEITPFAHEWDVAGEVPARALREGGVDRVLR